MEGSTQRRKEGRKEGWSEQVMEKRGEMRGDRREVEGENQMWGEVGKMREKKDEEQSLKTGGRQEVIHRRGQSLFCLFAAAVKPIFWLGSGNILYFIKLQSAELCLC